MFGLQDSDILFMINFAIKHPEIEALGVFGSRSVGTHKKTSDIDIIFYGKNINEDILQKAYEVLDENSPYPFFVDIAHYESIHDLVFKQEVEKNVRMIYKKA